MLRSLQAYYETLTIGNVVKQTTGNIVKHSAQYLNYEVDILHTDMYN